MIGPLWTQPRRNGDERSALDRNRFRLRTLVIVFAAESLLLGVIQLPQSLDFISFAIMDRGTNLTVQRLLDRGLVPTVDFGYQYGLAALLVGRAWFALFGRTPEAYALVMLVFDVLVAWGLARCAFALRAGPVGIVLILLTMPGTTVASYINIAHAGEAALITHALAEHAFGRRSRALAPLDRMPFHEAGDGLCVRPATRALDRSQRRDFFARAVSGRSGCDRMSVRGGTRLVVWVRTCDRVTSPGARCPELPGLELRVLLRNRSVNLAT